MKKITKEEMNKILGVTPLTTGQRIAKFIGMTIGIGILLTSFLIYAALIKWSWITLF